MWILPWRSTEMSVKYAVTAHGHSTRQRMFPNSLYSVMCLPGTACNTPPATPASRLGRAPVSISANDVMLSPSS